MKKNLLVIGALFICIITSGQTPKFMIDVEVGYLRFKNDSEQFRKPKSISITTSGCTEIFLLGKSHKYEFGMRIEILETKLTGEKKYLVGKVYYIKNNNQWQEIMKIQHTDLVEVRPIAKREKMDMFISGGASIDSPDFDVRLNDSYYVMQ